MVRWYHAIFTAYGFWLPNDPRGSWSTFIGAWELYRFGPATTTGETRSLAHDPHDARRRHEAKRALKYPPVRFDAAQREVFALGIAQSCDESGIALNAAAIGYDHVHAIVERHAKPVERILGQFKGRATQQLQAAGRHPLARFARPGEPPPTPWSARGWSVFIDDESHARTAIAHVERHPMKEGLPPQRWSFVKPL